MATATDAVSSGGERSTLGAGIAEHAAAVTLLIMLEPADSQGFSSLMNTFGERVVAASGRAKSEGGASRRSGIVSAAASLLGLRFETTPAPVQAEHRASLIDQDVWVDPRTIQSNAEFLEATPPSQEDAMYHRSVSGAGTPGQFNIATPPSTVPYGARTPPRNSMPGPRAAEERPISSGSLPPPSGGQSRHSQASCSLSELRRRELQVGRAIKLEQLAQMRIAAAEAEVARFDAQIAYEEARSASSNAHSSRLHAGNRDNQAEEQRLPIADS